MQISTQMQNTKPTNFWEVVSHIIVRTRPYFSKFKKSKPKDIDHIVIYIWLRQL